MTQTQLLQEFSQLALPQQLELLQQALRVMRQAVPGSVSTASVPTKKNLSEAAHRLRDDYSNDPELTAFTALDGEPVHAAQ